MRMSRVALSGIGSIVVLASSAVPASGARNPYTATGVCGPGFGIVDRHQLRDHGALMATTFLLYDASTGRNCAVTLKRREIGRPSWVTAELRRPGGAKKKAKGIRHNQLDQGSFSYYAGAVTILATHQCVRWGGEAMQLKWIEGGWWSISDDFLSRWSHCA